MDPITAVGILIASLTRLSEFGIAIANARNEGRDLTADEVAKFKENAQLHLDALDAQIKAAGG